MIWASKPLNCFSDVFFYFQVNYNKTREYACMYEHFGNTERGMRTPCSIRVHSHKNQSHREHIYQKMQCFNAICRCQLQHQIHKSHHVSHHNA